MSGEKQSKSVVECSTFMDCPNARSISTGASLLSRDKSAFTVRVLSTQI